MTISAREGYRLWAPRYETETAVSALDEEVVAALGVRVAGRRLLDVGCGTARRLRDTSAAFALGVDLAVEMLERAPASAVVGAADARALPVRDGAFDVVWCRLAIGHVADAAAVYGELARVCAPRGRVVVTDFHPAAWGAGHRRTFRDAAGVEHDLEHHVHTLATHTSAARMAGLRLDATRDGVVGPLIQPFYAEAHRLAAYAAQRGLPLVLGLAFTKTT